MELLHQLLVIVVLCSTMQGSRLMTPPPPVPVQLEKGEMSANNNDWEMIKNYKKAKIENDS